MQDVPKEAYYVGMAGVIPYMATSLSTVYCAWEINHASETGTGLLFSERTAELCLHILEPLQIGYGAVVCRKSGARLLNVPNSLVTNRTLRLSPAWAPFTGVSNGPVSVATKATRAT